MSEIPSGGAAIGKVIGYRTSWNPLSHESYVVIKVNDSKISVPIDTRQQMFVQKEYPVGSRVAVGFYGGAWHIGSKPVEENLLLFDNGVSIQEVIDGLKKADRAKIIFGFEEN
jgi:hypothetical protein